MPVGIGYVAITVGVDRFASTFEDTTFSDNVCTEYWEMDVPPPPPPSVNALELMVVLSASIRAVTSDIVRV
jgi:hypothetical protein